MLGRKVSWAVCLGFVAVLVLGGCDDGGIWASATFNVDGTSVSCSGLSGAGYEISAGITVIAAQASVGSQYPSIGIVLPGAATGTLTEADGVMVTYSESATSAFTAMLIIPGTSCTVTITDYGSVGGLVEGTFSAVVSDGTSTLTITNGTFSVVRMPDA